MVAEDTAAVLEEASDVIEDTIDLLERRVSWLTTNPKTAALAALVGGIVLGGTAAYFVLEKRLSAKYRAIADEEVESVKNRYSILKKDGPEHDLATLASAYSDGDRAVSDTIIEREGYVSYDRVARRPTLVEEPQTPAAIIEQAVVEDDVVVRNVFDSDEPDTYFDVEEETARRNERPLEPFVITKDEFDANETDFNQEQLTYFDGDGVLCDSNDKTADVDVTIGSENVLRFGHGSGDPSIVYIRNPRLELDMEIVRSEGDYAKEVLGYDGGNELRHSHTRAVRRFRATDD